MPILAAAVIVLTVLVVIDLALTTAVIRRLRVFEVNAAAARPEVIEIAIGAEVPDFGRRTLLGFYSTTCAPCAAEAPELVRRGPRLAGDGITVVPVLMVPPGTDPAALAGVLAGAGAVLTEPPGGPVATAFGAQATPSYVLVDPDGRVAAKGTIDDCLSLATR
jgi:hypothetical protein